MPAKSKKSNALSSYFSTLGKLGAEAKNAKDAGRRPRKLKLDLHAPKSVRAKLSEFGTDGGFAKAQAKKSKPKSKRA
jgi:hypothetical protein